jgi:hypothetical protein
LAARVGEIVNVSANAPHASPTPPLQCPATARQENFFLAVGDRVATRTEPLPQLDEATKTAFIMKSQALAPNTARDCYSPKRTRRGGSATAPAITFLLAFLSRQSGRAQFRTERRIYVHAVAGARPRFVTV